MGQQSPADSRNFAASFPNPQRDCQFMSHGEGHILEHPAAALSYLDLGPRNKERGVHEPKKKYAGRGCSAALQTPSNKLALPGCLQEIPRKLCFFLTERQPT
jgi:hypothetical protein